MSHQNDSFIVLTAKLIQKVNNRLLGWKETKDACYPLIKLQISIFKCQQIRHTCNAVKDKSRLTHFMFHRILLSCLPMLIEVLYDSFLNNNFLYLLFMCLKTVGDDTINGLIIMTMVLKTTMLSISKGLMCWLDWWGEK